MINRCITVFFVALGVVIGGTLIGGVAAIYTRESPLKLMSDISQRIKVYAVVSSIGGALRNLRMMEGSVFQGEILLLFQQVIVIVIGFIGANIGVWIIRAIIGDF